MSLLAVESLKNILREPGLSDFESSKIKTKKDVNFVTPEAYLEYLLSICTSIKYNDGVPIKPASQSEYETLTNEALNVLEQTGWYYFFLRKESKNLPIQTSKSNLLSYEIALNKLALRGNAYHTHTKETYLDLFSGLDDSIYQKIGFRSIDHVEVMDNISQQLQHNIQLYSSSKGYHIIASQRFRELELKHPELNHDELRTLFAEKYRVLDWLTWVSIFFEKLFEVKPRTNKETRIYDHLSIKIGENYEFLSSPFGATPFKETLIQKKPIIKHDGKYYCFLPQLFRHLEEQMVEIVGITDEKFLFSFHAIRDKYLESASSEILKTILQASESQIYQNLFFGDYECDLLIVYDRCLFIVEMKAGKLKESSIRGSEVSFYYDMREIVGEAFIQTTRALNHIKNSTNADFYNKKGEKVLTIKADDYEFIFPVSVYYEPVARYITNLSLMNELNLIQGYNHWAVYINDLKVFRDLVEFPTQFIHYLIRRFELPGIELLHNQDELDLLGLYFSNNMHLTGHEQNTAGKIFLYDLAEDIDQYYLGLDINLEVEKPRQKMPSYFKILVENIDNQKMLDFTIFNKVLLDCDGSTRQSIDDKIYEWNKKFAKNQKWRSMAMQFSETEIVLRLTRLSKITQFDEWVKDSKKYFHFQEKSIVKELFLICWVGKLAKNTTMSILRMKKD